MTNDDKPVDLDALDAVHASCDMRDLLSVWADLQDRADRDAISALVRLRNAYPALSAELRALRAQVDRLNHKRGLEIERYGELVSEVLALRKVRDAAAELVDEEVLQNWVLVDDASPLLMALVDALREAGEAQR